LTEREAESPALLRALGRWDAVLLTIGSVIGTGIFLTTADIARELPHGGFLLAVWLVGGILTLAGALTYAELGAMFPEAGGIYSYLREAWGTLPAFLYGWGAFLVIMSGGIAALAVGFGHYLGGFVPWFAPEHVVAVRQLGGWTWTLSGAQVAGVGAILVLTTVNHFGLRQGAWTQNILTAIKVAAFGGFCLFGVFVPARAMPALTAALPSGHLLAAFGVAMIAALWTYDGWYGATFSAGEMKDPERTLPFGLVVGTTAITALYLLLNWVYLRALPIERMGEESRIGEAAATALFGVTGGKAMAAAILVSTFGCLASTILYSPRIYGAMAADGVFFPALARIHPRWRVPTRALWAQTGWAILLTVSGTYDQIYTYVVFVAVLFHVGAGAAVFRLRRTRPDATRPFRVPGWPWIPLAFLAASLLLAVNTLNERPVESLAGLGLLALGWPAYAYWRRHR